MRHSSAVEQFLSAATSHNCATQMIFVMVAVTAAMMSYSSLPANLVVSTLILQEHRSSMVDLVKI